MLTMKYVASGFGTTSQFGGVSFEIDHKTVSFRQRREFLKRAGDFLAKEEVPRQIRAGHAEWDPLVITPQRKPFMTAREKMIGSFWPVLQPGGLDDDSVVVKSNHYGAHLAEYGPTIIRAKKAYAKLPGGPFLHIPGPHVVGAEREHWHPFRKNWRTWALLNESKTSGVIVQRTGRGKRSLVKVIGWLRKHVTVPRRRLFKWNIGIRSRIVGIFNQTIRETPYAKVKRV